MRINILYSNNLNTYNKAKKKRNVQMSMYLLRNNLFHQT